jgi:8-oxo-dGTP pyrophosphatase MutT (NUDIX family)
MAEIIELAKIRRSRKKTAKRQSKSFGKAKKHHSAGNAWPWESFKDSLLTMPLAAEMMSSQQAAPPMSSGRPTTLESGVLAFRRESNGDPRVLLITRRRSKKWGIPKGRVVPHLSFRENAVKEAFEEAGVVGHVSPFSVGVFRAEKRRANSPEPEVIEVWVYLLEVAEMLSDWPEREKRAIRWVTCDAAARRLSEPVLVHLCHRLAQN